MFDNTNAYSIEIFSQCCQRVKFEKLEDSSVLNGDFSVHCCSD